ncbi:MAG: S8 family serine peptidase [Bacteroidetes bacterium]|nr:S8 family serine peptidase [Bacteroidota bacterium]
MKHLLRLALFLLPFATMAQTEGSIKTFNGRQFIYGSGGYSVFYSKTNQLFPILGNTVVVKYKPEATIGEIALFENQNSLNRLGSNQLGFVDYGLLINSAEEIFQKAEILLNSSLVYNVEIVSEKYGYKTATPNNGNLGCNQWYLDVLAAWGVSKGSPNVIVAVIDGGIDKTRPDLGLGPVSMGAFSNVFENPGEKGLDANNMNKETNGIDDDQNGFIDDVSGWNFLDDNNNTSPNSFNFSHGTSVASVISAKINNYFIDGVAGGNGPGVKIMPIKILDQINGLGQQTITATSIDDAIIYAVNNGAKIINISFWCSPSIDIDAAIQYAYSHNVLLISAVGNNNGSAVVYPANLPEVAAISSETFNQTDFYHRLSNFSNKGAEVALGARGQDVCVLTTNPVAGFETLSENGTSFSAPYVAGTAALMLSANSCLSNKQLLEIMEQTATKAGARFNHVTNQWELFDYNWNNKTPGHSQEFGYGLVNTNKAVKAAKYMSTANKDLYIKDADGDFGLTIDAEMLDIDPNYPFGYDKSPDIWVRNIDDNGTEHQNPEFTNGQPVWVYVRVRNKGCIPSNSTDVLNLNWSKAASWSSWPQNWDGSNPNMGNSVGQQSIGVILPGQEKIFKFQWNLTVPIANNGWKSCLMSVISSSNDPTTYYPNRLDKFITYNNNVAINNVTIVDILPGIQSVTIGDRVLPPGGFMHVCNPLSTTMAYDLHIKSQETPSKSTIVNQAEVSLLFYANDWELMEQNDIDGNVGVERIRKHEIVVKEPDVKIRNITLPPNTYIPVYVGFNFLTQEITSDSNFVLQISQTFADSSRFLGSESYYIRKYNRIPFLADAGTDKAIFLGQSTLLTGGVLPELAYYKWV